MRFSSIVFLMASLTFAGEAVLAQPSSDPIPVIIETDLGNDIDDALALDLAYQAVCDGKIDLKMVSVHKKSPTACAYADILNRWYGYPEVCVAQARTP
ncbi:MAG: nucleoside hydrolase, partial [Bacteroidales bacterium]|nr:nucleoside hydrolase [Bacteroidales bacterium]